MTRLLTLFAALAGALTLTAAAPRDWTTVARPAPQGSYVVGNPAAKVKLVEYVSYTCPHCRHFEEEAAPTLKAKWVRSGSTSIEYRNAIHDKLDLAAALLARCSGAAAFPRVHAAFYADQSAWLDRGADFDQANGARLQLYPQDAQLRALADGAGLVALAKQAGGMTDAAVAACFADPAQLNRVLQVSAAAVAKSNATPAFEVNGKLVTNVDWAKLQPILAAAGAR